LAKIYGTLGTISAATVSVEDVNQPLLLAGRKADIRSEPELLLHIPGQLIVSCLGVAAINLTGFLLEL
jgi:hypothetical protein